MIRKILIANRGEIAVRIIRACNEMGITSVAVYTDDDRHALFVKKANESYPLGPDAQGGYLNSHKLLTIAKTTGCDGIHPGYGFLSENPNFAKQCEQEGIIFIGPMSRTIQLMGDKLEARKTMQLAGIPVIPGSNNNLNSLDEALDLAQTLGYPVMLKATAGGGGRGIRRCDNPSELQRFFARVQSEAEKSFGSTLIFMEKAIINPRHIEVQILGDTQNNLIHLYERDCSIQRRHQKLIEVAPSPQITEDQRSRVCSLALQAGNTVSYTNAGTVEFILDQDGNFYFLEMNTRLQVEHPITEMITGIDIVQEQIRIASGYQLSVSQKDIQFRGVAIEFRINAEDPTQDFIPSIGKITRYFAPGGPGVRIDGALYTGYVFPPHYDSLLAKLSVWALDWNQLIARSKRALTDLNIYGVKTTIPYYLNILGTEEFRNPQFDTGFVSNHPELSQNTSQPENTALITAISAALAAYWKI